MNSSESLAASVGACGSIARLGAGRGGQDDRPRRRQSAGQLLQPDQAIGRGRSRQAGHQGHHRRRQGRRPDAGQPDPGPADAEDRRADLHPGRRCRRRRAGQARPGCRRSRRQRRPQRRGRAGRHLHRHELRRSAKNVCDYILKQAGGKGKMVIIHGQKGTTPEVDRVKGCAEVDQGQPRHQGRRRAVLEHLEPGRRLPDRAEHAAGASGREDRLRPGRRSRARRRAGDQGRRILRPKSGSPASTATRPRSRPSRTACSTSPRRSRPS